MVWKINAGLLSLLKKNLATIALLAGAAAFNLSVLCQAHCDVSHKEELAHMDVPAGQCNLSGMCVARGIAGAGKAVNLVSLHLHKDSANFKCGSCADGHGLNADLKLDSSSVEAAPRERAVSVISLAAAGFTGIGPGPLERPPRQFV